ncbi:MAG: nucleoside monophosphate kinase [Bacteroidetes bacterium]|nr:nucleoside monophosphate kinase [Bacteroidota bacterium]
MNIILLGPPGAGKGTAAKEICKLYNLFPFYAGDLLRERMSKTDDFAKYIREIINNGALLPNDAINKMVEEFLTSDTNIENIKNNGILFDGYPRTIEQATFLEKLLSDNNQKIDKVLYLYIDDAKIIKRIVARRIDKNTGNIYNLISNPPPPNVKTEDLYQRDDDKEYIIKNRLNIYKKMTEPLIDFYNKRHLVSEVDGSKEVQEMFCDINEILK